MERHAAGFARRMGLTLLPEAARRPASTRPPVLSLGIGFPRATRENRREPEGT